MIQLWSRPILFDLGNDPLLNTAENPFKQASALKIKQTKKWLLKIINVGRNILINAQLKKIFFISNDRKKGNKTEKDSKKTRKKKISPVKVILVKMRYQIKILWSLVNSNQKQASKALAVVAVMMRKKVLKIK